MAEPTTDQASPIAEIAHGPSAFERFLDKNQKSMIVLSIVIALGVGAWVVVSGMEKGKRLAAGEALVAAEDVAAMQDVVKNHAGTPAAVSAAVLLSDMQWDEGQQSAAIDTLRNEIESSPDHPATAPARARLATRLLQQGEQESAKAQFEEIVARADSAFLAPYALLSLAEIARENGDIETSRELLTRSTEDYPDNPLNSLVTESIAFIDFQMPEAVDPPAEPEAPTEPADTPMPEPDFSAPIQLDPTSPSGDSGNPLLDNLTRDEESPEAPPEETPAEDDQEPAPESAEDSAPEATHEDAEESTSDASE